MDYELECENIVNEIKNYLNIKKYNDSPREAFYYVELLIQQCDYLKQEVEELSE